MQISFTSKEILFQGSRRLTPAQQHTKTKVRDYTWVHSLEATLSQIYTVKAVQKQPYQYSAKLKEDKVTSTAWIFLIPLYFFSSLPSAEKYNCHTGNCRGSQNWPPVRHLTPVTPCSPACRSPTVFEAISFALHCPVLAFLSSVIYQQLHSL